VRRKNEKKRLVFSRETRIVMLLLVEVAVGLLSRRI
jgi:hypothetical protein